MARHPVILHCIVRDYLNWLEPLSFSLREIVFAEKSGTSGHCCPYFDNVSAEKTSIANKGQNENSDGQLGNDFYCQADPVQALI